MLILRKSAVAKVSLFSSKEKEKILKPLQVEVNKAKELKELAAISALVKPSLAREEFTPLANAMYKAGTSLQAAEHEQEVEGGDRRVSIDESFGAIVAHLKDIQVQAQIGKERSDIIQL